VKAKIEQGKLTGFYIGISDQKDFIEVPEEIAGSPNDFDYIDGKFVEKKCKEPVKKRSLEQRVETLEQLVADLASLQLGV
jgi:hypothetical protein